jgi:CRISPR-associated protein Cas1
MLNYAYGVLYSKVESACIIAGLDPYVGILHTDSYNKLSLVYDVIEMFRPWAEETVIFLFTGRKVDDEFFRESKGGIFLDKPGKQVLITALNEMFEKTERYQKRNIKRINIIQFRCHQIANQILKEVKYDAGVGDLRHNGEQTQESCGEDLQTDGIISCTEIGLSGDSGSGGD